MTHRPQRKLARIPLLLVLAVVLSPAAAIAAPPLLNYQGYVTDNVGQPMTGNHQMQFEMFADSTGGPALWSETYAAVDVAAGVFNVLLGSVTPLPVGTLFTGNMLWLQTTVDGNPLLPRRPVVSVAYALWAENSGIRTIARTQGHLMDNTDNGLLVSRSVSITKKYAATGIRVAWNDNFRIATLNKACRWEILFNGAPCANPGGLFFDQYEGGTSSNRHDLGSVFGTCFGIPAGAVTIATRVSPTPGYAAPCDCLTGWFNQLFSIEAEEVR